MEYIRPKEGEVYKHFKGNVYRVVAIAKHSETLEEMVVYQELNGENIYVRPLPMFVERLDDGTYRFELQKNTSKISIMDFLDLHTAKEKIQYLEFNKMDLTEDFISVAAQSMEFALNDGSLEDRLRELLQYLKTLEKYEARR